MNERIAQALIKQFDRDRIIFWYDSKQELRDDFESLELDRVIKIELKNEPLQVKRNYSAQLECGRNNTKAYPCKCYEYFKLKYPFAIMLYCCK